MLQQKVWFVLRAIIPELVAIAITVLVLAFYFSIENNHIKAIEKRILTEEQEVLSEQVESFRDSIRQTFPALNAFANLVDYSGSPTVRIAALRAFSDGHPHFLQLRHISEQGMEMIRVDRRGEQVVVVPDDQLQDKSGRQYVYRALQTPPGQFFVSKLELNVEFGQVEIPHRPVIRVAYRMAAGEGFVIINLDATKIVSRLTTPYNIYSTSWLINSQADWLIGPEKKLEWGFMLGQRHYASEYLEPDLVNKMLARNQYSQLLTDLSFYVSEHVTDEFESSVNNRVHFDEGLIFIRRFAPDYMTATMAESRLASPVLVVLLSLILPGALLWLYRLSNRYRRLLDHNRQSQLELRRLQGLADFLPQLTWTCDTHGVCDFISQTWVDYTGSTQEQLLGSGWAEFVHPDDKEDLMHQWMVSVSTGTDFLHRFRILSKEGEYRMFDTRAKALSDADGRVLKWFGSNTDIQDAIDHEQALEADRDRLSSELESSQAKQEQLLKRLQLATQSSGAGIWEYRLDDQTLLWDERMYQLYGLEPHSDLEPYSCWVNALHPDDLGPAESLLNEAIRETGQFDCEFRVIHPSGKVAWIKADAIVQYDGERPYSVIGANRDISAQKQLTRQLQEANENLQTEAAKAREAAAAKSRFLANMSHEIRTPVNGVIGMLSLLRNSPLEPQQRVYTDKAFFASERLLGILNDVLDISRIDSGRLELNLTTFSVESLIQDSVDLFAVTAEEKGVTLGVDVDPSVPLYIGADQLRLGQVVSNLVGNAIKFTAGPGQVDVSFAAPELSAQERMLEVVVKDTGIGLSSEQIELIFEEFTQADESTTRRYGGTGLGLTICQRLTSLMSGTLDVRSELGKGSEFRLKVPVQAAQSAPVLADLRLNDLEVMLLTSGPEQQDMVDKHLRHWGTSLLTVKSFQDVVEQLPQINARNKQPVLLIDGAPMAAVVFETIAADNALRTQLTEIKVLVFVAANISAAMRYKMQELGFEVISRPLTPSRIYDALNQIGNLPGPAAAESSQVIHYPGLRVLSVDDIELNRDVVEGLLTPLQIELTQAASGVEALASMENSEFDLVLMDIHMEGMSGLDATRSIRSLDVKQPLIFGLSASVMDEDRQAGKAAGMDDYLTKPFRVEDFVTALSQAGISGEVVQAQAASGSDKAVFDCPAFIDVERAMAQLSGDPKLLKNCIRSFVSGFDGFEQEYAAAIAAVDLEQSRKLMHKLRGATANIADVELSTLAAQQEEAHGSLEISRAGDVLQLFRLHYKLLAASLQQDEEPAAASAMEAAEFKTLMADFFDKIRRQSYINHDERGRYLQALQQQNYADQAQAIEKALLKFDFAAASQVFETMGIGEGNG